MTCHDMNLMDLCEMCGDVLRGIFEFRWTVWCVIKYIIIMMAFIFVCYWFLHEAGGSELVDLYDKSRGGRITP